MNSYTFEDLKIGFSEEFQQEISLEKLEDFIRISGDNNPLHAKKSYALEKGMKDRVLHGLLTSSLYSTLVGVYLPGEKCLLQSIDIKFKKPVFPGEKLTVKGTVKEKKELFKILIIKAEIKNEVGEKISTAKIQVGVI